LPAGGERGIAHALECLHEEILSRAALIYIKVSYEESVQEEPPPRAQRGGALHPVPFAPRRKDGILYRTNDWETIASRDPAYIRVKDFRVPYAVFENEPEKTSDPQLIAAELAA
jgi:hypothetical protein